MGDSRTRAVDPEPPFGFFARYFPLAAIAVARRGTEVTVSATLRSLPWESLVSATTDTSSVVRRESVRAEAATARHASQISSATQNMEPLSAPFVDTGKTMRSLRHLDDEECAARAQRGDVAAFSALVARYQDRIFRFLVRLTRSQDDAMELTQETFLNAYQALARWRPDARFTTWLFRIARNQAFDWLRRRKLVEFVALEDGQDLGIEDPAPTPDAALETVQRFHGLERALARLPTEHREILLLREIEEMSYENIAEVLDISLGTVKSRIARARAGLLEKIPR